MKLHRVVVSWSGPSVVGRAVTVLHYDGSNQTAPPVAAITGAFGQLSQQIPQGVRIQVPNSGESIEDTTGHLVDVWSGPQQDVVTGSTVPGAAAGVGACVTWNTGGIVNGKKGPRRLRGRTFIVPLANTVYEADGTIQASTMQGLLNFAAALRASGPLAVWHRPTTVGGTDGNSYAVLSSNVRDKVAFLSSRRD